jgi:sugar phosphate isomerase/epimerase
MNRRDFLATSAMAGLSLATLSPLPIAAAEPNTATRRMTIDLVPGAIGVSAGQREAIELAAKHGFESVGADAGYLAGLSKEQHTELKALMTARKLVFGAAGLPVEFRQDQARFDQDLKSLPRMAQGLNAAGITRVSTWLAPSSDRLTYLQNFKQHAARLREASTVLKEHGLRLGLEYVGPKTSWSSRRFPFIHTMTEMKELVAEIGTGNVGFLLDTWHWWHAAETEADILTLKGEDVVAVDLNDAPAGIPRDQQVDSRRELPAATGEIPVASFLRALQQIGYDGPVRAEPFNQKLNSLDNEEACAVTAAALKKAFSLAF